MKHFLGKNNVRLKKHVNFVIYILFLYFCRPFFNIIQMYAIVEIAGQQFKVSEKQEVFVNRIDSKEGSKIILDKVLLLDKDGKIDVGVPTLKGVGVTAKIVEHLKSDKVLVFKKKRRKGYRVKNGFRHSITKIEIQKIGDVKLPSSTKSSTKKKDVNDVVEVKSVAKKTTTKKTTTKKTTTKKTTAKKTTAKKTTAKKTTAKKSS